MHDCVVFIPDFLPGGGGGSTWMWGFHFWEVVLLVLYRITTFISCERLVELKRKTLFP